MPTNDPKYTTWGNNTVVATNQFHTTLPPTYNTFNTMNSVPLCPAGHVIDGEFLIYDDGLLVANCTNCQDRITLQELPAGDAPARVRGIIEALLDGNFSPEMLFLVSKLRRDVAALEERIEETVELLKVVDAIITQNTE